MQAARPPFLRGILLLAALAAIAFIMARGESPAQATSYDPHNNVSVSDSSPGASADIVINFSLDAPDSFPNVRTNSSIQFLPRQWGIHNPPTETADGADIGPPETGAQCFNGVDDDGDGFADDGCPGGIAGSFNALSTLGIMGVTPCSFPIPVPFTMIDATTDTSHLASALDLGGDYHPGGVGYSGQFVDDPDTLKAPGDLGLPLIPFNSNEKKTSSWGTYFDGEYSAAYRDLDNSGNISAGDFRLVVGDYEEDQGLTAGTVVQPGDWDTNPARMPYTLIPFRSDERHAENVADNGQLDPGEWIYRDKDNNGTVSYGDVRLFEFGMSLRNSVVEDFALLGGVSRYPDFLNQIFPPEAVGEPLARQWGGRMVIMSAVSLNIVTYRPGQLPGYPATLGYPNVVVLLNPVAPVDLTIINLTSDLCTPLSLTSTNFGVSQDNPTTAADEGGYVRLTNPKAEKDHTFTLVTTSQPDADNDGIENMLDTCPLTPNIHDLDGRNNGEDPWAYFYGGSLANPDGDDLDGACDPEEYPAPDLGRALVPFKANEKRYGYFYGRWAIYGDNDGSGSITPGDDRLSSRTIGSWAPGVVLQPGVVQDSDADYRNPGTGAVLPLYWRELGNFPGFAKHSENVAANGRYDVGEDVYRDNDGSNDVSLGDERFLSGGQFSEDLVGFCCSSPLGPAMYTPDEDLDNYGNRADNCPTDANGLEVLGIRWIQLRSVAFNVITPGDLIGPNNQTDTDGDDIGDACDPDPYTVTGHLHPVTLTQGVPIAKHGVKLDDLDGKEKVAAGGSASYKVSLENKGGSAEDFPVAVRVVEGCGTVSGPSTVHVNGDASANAQYTVDFSGCAAGEYTVQADACHAGDAAPAGLFGEGACPGASDGLADTNTLDDAPQSIIVEVGTP